jgi:DNA repair protein RecO (recombination protein O)
VSHQRIDFEPAHLLVQRPYRETSELIEVFSREHGRVGLVARGVRGPKSKLRGVLAPFQPLLLSWTERGELGTLAGAEVAGTAIAFEGDRIFHGWYLNELLLKLLHRDDPHPELYDDYVAALAKLAASAQEAEVALRVFEKRLLEQLGYGLPLDAEFDALRWYRLDAALGFVETVTGEPGACLGASLAALRDEQLADRVALADARRLLRRALEPHIPYASLRTPRLLRELRASRVEVH